MFSGSSPNKARTSRVNFSVLGFYRETGYIERFVLLVELSHMFMETEKSHDVLFVSRDPGRSVGSLVQVLTPESAGGAGGEKSWSEPEHLRTKGSLVQGQQMAVPAPAERAN